MQASVFPLIRDGADILVVAPTGSGKTEAALLPVLDLLRKDEKEGIRAVYITPLRALNRDMIDRVQRLVATTELTVAVRHGDTPSSERRKQAATPPDILITTPETLQAILPGKLMQRHLKAVQFVIIDEVHQFAHDRRGIQLTVGLQRLRRIAEHGFQRIGLSATVGHPDAVASVFGGEKPLSVLYSDLEKPYEYRLEWPRPIDKDFESARDLYITPVASSWPSPRTTRSSPSRRSRRPKKETSSRCTSTVSPSTSWPTRSSDAPWITAGRRLGRKSSKRFVPRSPTGSSRTSKRTAWRNSSTIWPSFANRGAKSA